MGACHHIAGVTCDNCRLGTPVHPIPAFPGHYNPHYPTQMYPIPTQWPHKCPVCEGKGTVPEDFYDSPLMGTSDTECRTCHKAGIVWR